VYQRVGTVLCLAGAPALSHSGEVSIMAELHILSLECLDKEDANANDEITLQINGTTVFGPQKMADGDVVNLLNSVHPFTGSVAVNLIEQDGASVDDFLGTSVIADTVPKNIPLTEVFSHAALPHAHYHMRFHVHP
jgi:hypothetical protein